MALKVEVKVRNAPGQTEPVQVLLRKLLQGADSAVNKKFTGSIGNFQWADKGTPDKYTGAHGRILELGRSSPWRIPVHSAKIKSLRIWRGGGDGSWVYRKAQMHPAVKGRHFVEDAVNIYNDYIRYAGGIAFRYFKVSSADQTILGKQASKPANLPHMPLSAKWIQATLNNHLQALKSNIAANTPRGKYTHAKYGKSINKEEYKNKKSDWYVPLPIRMKQRRLADAYIVRKIRMAKAKAVKA